MTFAPIRKWWLKPFAWIARCQSKDIHEQWKAGVRYFDFRLRFDGNGLPVPAHGLAEYYASPTTSGATLHHLAEISQETVYIRLTLESTSKRNAAYQERMFAAFCRSVQSLFSESDFVILCGGQTKRDWHTVYDFGNTQPVCKELYSSMPAQRNPLWKIWPWLYARHIKRKLRKEQVSTRKYAFLMIDFV